MKADVVKHLTEVLGLEKEELPEFIDAFMTSFGDCINQLAAIPSADDFMAIRRVTHTLFGFSQNVGAFDLYERAVTLNTSAKALDVNACKAGIAALNDLYAAYQAE